MSTWLITGCSTGLGRAFAEEALARGHDVVVTARDASAVQDVVDAHPDHALAVALDVTDGDQVTAAVAAATERFGGVDVLVNNAGYGYRSAVEEGDDDDVARLFDTHFHGSVRTIKAVLPGMRARRSGTIVNLSSIGARRTGPGSGYYGAVKAAIEQMTMALRTELAPLGITATVVEPGSFRTDFSGRSLTQSATPIADYAETAGRRRIEADTSDGTQPGDPAAGARLLVDAVESGSSPYLLLLGSDAVDIVTRALDDLRGDIDAWAERSRATDFDA
ncbi:SDR family NAD(P)-dependent oxidoreductase [Frigoribacterium sp. VKM Ac-1396]|uniref:oxidoreductase n=1 Tax=Frigoribacterium sp. VKM Ac-1396 TaxID=2783821 RepID=UPI00188A0907|nr:oxidoreductase [Frigoribacterium sp. VKM Ac-1396]MBF4600598.1 SDR family NAD(P)-dependent oxidoreductase [Frigoribacterium sp. VKM Ac-1396]